MRKVFEDSIYELMKKNERIVALVADSGTGRYSDIKKEMPQRYLEFGIAENNMIAHAAGLASEGLIPVVYAINNFLAYRSYEFIRNDLCLDQRNVKLVGLGAGVIQNMQGPTHHTLEDIAALRALPGLTLLSPCSPKETRPALEAAIDLDGPVYIRLAKAYELEVYEGEADFQLGKVNTVLEGDAVTVFATGSIVGDACQAAKLLGEDHIRLNVVSVSTLKPLDEEGVVREALKTGRVLTLEEHNTIGGLGGSIAEVLATRGIGIPFVRMGFQDVFCRDYGWHQDLKRMYGLSPEDIARECRALAGRN